MEAYDLIPDGDLPSGVRLIEKKKNLMARIGVKSSAEGEYAYPESELRESEDTIDFGKANMLTVEVEEEASPEESQRKVEGDRSRASEAGDNVEEVSVLGKNVVKMSTRFGEGDIDYDLVWSDGNFYFVVYGQPFSIVEALARLTIQRFQAAFM